MGHRIILWCCLLLASGAGHAQPGALDPGFAGDGVANFSILLGIPGSDDEAYALAVRPDDRIVAVGSTGPAGAKDFALLGSTFSGGTDYAFGSDGRLSYSLGPGDDIARAVVLRPGGKVVAGGSTDLGSGPGFALLRTVADGSLDTTFGDGGMVRTAMPDTFTAEGRALAVQSGGRILLAGGGTAGFVIARYEADGAIDSTFGVDGLVRLHFSSGTDRATAIAVQPDDHILVTGWSDGPVTDSIAMARLMPDGSLDATFGTGGTARADPPDTSARAVGMALMADGRFVVAGNSSGHAMAARFLPDGTPDASFNGSGFGLYDALTTTSSLANAVLVQADGHIVLAGNAWMGVSNRAMLAQVNDDGTLDTGFDNDGFSIEPIAAYTFGVNAICTHLNDRLLIAATGNNVLGGDDMILARFLPHLTTGIDEENVAPQAFSVQPVPLDATSVVHFALPVADRVTIELFDAQGRLVHRALDDALLGAGEHTMPLRCPDAMAHGHYTVCVRARTLVARTAVLK